jgi:hypothetical protein
VEAAASPEEHHVHHQSCLYHPFPLALGTSRPPYPDQWAPNHFEGDAKTALSLKMKHADVTVRNLILNHRYEYLQAGGSPGASEDFLHRAKHVKGRYEEVAAPLCGC